jgi:benzodiazapine receptor
MTDDRDTQNLATRAEPARDLAASDIDTTYDPDATRPIAVMGEPSSPLDRPRRINTESEWFWPIVNLIGLAAVILINWLANQLEFNGQSTGDVVNKDPVWFQPAGWAFSIWSVIYALLIAFVIYGLLPAGRRNPWVQRISPLFLLSNIANITWLLLWHQEWFPASMVTILVLLASLAGIYTILHWRRTDEREALKGERYVVWPAFSIYLGWIVVASMSNFSVLLDREGWSGGPFSQRWWAVILLVLAGVISAFFAFIRREAWIPMVIAFAALAIAVKQWDRSTLVSVTALVVGVLAAVLAIAGVMMAFDRRAMLGAYSHKHETSDLP